MPSEMASWTSPRARAASRTYLVEVLRPSDGTGRPPSKARRTKLSRIIALGVGPPGDSNLTGKETAPMTSDTCASGIDLATTWRQEPLWFDDLRPRAASWRQPVVELLRPLRGRSPMTRSTGTNPSVFANDIERAYATAQERSGTAVPPSFAPRFSTSRSAASSSPASGESAVRWGTCLETKTLILDAKSAHVK